MTERQCILPGFHERLIEASIATLQLYAPKDAPYWGCFSGGKDSIVIQELARRAGVAVDWHYNVTTIDPPELVRFIREHHPTIEWVWPKRGFFALLRTRGLPTRRARWCCSELKESQNPRGRRLIMGVRAAESRSRAMNWQVFSRHHKTDNLVVAPILHWKDADVWAFILDNGLPYCRLYDEGFKRLGCVGCPLSRGSRIRDFARWPKFERAYRAAFQDLWDLQAGTLQRDGREWFGSALFQSADEMWAWWISDEPLAMHGRKRNIDEDECQGHLELWG